MESREACREKRRLRQASKDAIWSRKKAIERLQSVNDISHTQTRKNSLTDRESASAFFGSLDRLNELALEDDNKNSTNVLFSREEAESGIQRARRRFVIVNR